MSSNLPLPVRILVIEDDESYFKVTLEKRAEQFNKNKKKEILLPLEHALTSEEGKELYKRNGGSSYYNGVIIDFLGVREKGGTKAESSSFVGLVKFFDGEDIAKVVITGQTTRQKEVEELCSGEFDLYFKGSSDRGEGKMLSDLWEKIQNSEEAKILNEHSEVFRVFNDYYDEKAKEINRNRLIDSIKNMDSTKSDDIENNIVRLRKIQEDIYGEINKKYPELGLQEHLKDGREYKTNLHGVLDALINKELLTEKGYIYYSSWSVRSTSGKYTAHSMTHKDLKETPTKYTVQALTYKVFDLILWFKTVVDNLQEKKSNGKQGEIESIES